VVAATTTATITSIHHSTTVEWHLEHRNTTSGSHHRK
jgi:hypothetical protein